MYNSHVYGLRHRIPINQPAYWGLFIDVYRCIMFCGIKVCCWMKMRKNRVISSIVYSLIVAENKVRLRKLTRNRDARCQQCNAGSGENDERTSVFHSLIDHNFGNYSIHLIILEYFHSPRITHSFIFCSGYSIGILNRWSNVCIHCTCNAVHLYFYLFCLTRLELVDKCTNFESFLCFHYVLDHVQRERHSIHLINFRVKMSTVEWTDTKVSSLYFFCSTKGRYTIIV